MISLFTPSLSNLPPSYLSICSPPSRNPSFPLLGQFDYLNIKNQWVLAARARPCAARTCLFELIATPNRALRAPLPAHRSFAVSYLTPKNILNLSNLGRPRQGPFSFHRNTEANIMYRCYHTPYFFLVFVFYCFWIFSIYYSLPFLLSFSISSYSCLLILLFLSLLILLVGAILRLPFLLLLYFKLFVDLQTCILMIYVHISVILMGFLKGPSLFYLLILLYCTLFFAEAHK